MGDSAPDPVAVSVGPATLRVVVGDLTEQRVDAVVNAANASLLGGGGVDGAIHRKGGPAILAACREVRSTRYPDGLPTGEAVATPAGDLPASAVIHTVGPVWRGGGAGEPALLAACYRNALALAAERGWSTVAFPAISTGVYGYPKPEAARIAVGTVAEVLRERPGPLTEVRLVVFSAADQAAYVDALSEAGLID